MSAEHIGIVVVGLRDGLQNNARNMSTQVPVTH